MLDIDLFGGALDTLLKRFENIHNFFYANDGLSEQQSLDEIIKILFVKFVDEEKNAHNFFVLREEEDEIKKQGKSFAFQNRINDLFSQAIIEYPNLFDPQEKINLSIQSLTYAITKLQIIRFRDSQKDAKGLAFQKFLSNHAKGGRGQFFTPDPIIKFCVELIQPKPSEKIIDPACGTGGFLFSVFCYIRDNYPNVDLQEYVNRNVFGIEINQRISQIAKMKFLLENNANANILCTNALSIFDDLNKKISSATFADLRSAFDIVLTNPPFGTQGRVTNYSILSQYELAYKWLKNCNRYSKSKDIQKAQVPEILFIERALQLLRPGGKMGIVLPNGHFENASLEYLRHYLKKQANILAIIKLPQETFIPYGTGVKASLLFMQKKYAKSLNQCKVFFSQITKLGYQGNKNGSPVYKKDGSGNIQTTKSGEKIIDEDYSKVIGDYLAFTKGNVSNRDPSFSIDHSTLNGRFDYDYYAPKNCELLLYLKKANSVRIRDIATIVNTKSKRIKNKDKYVEYVELSDVNTHSFEIINSTTLQIHNLPSRASYEIKAGDIITAVAGNSIGTIKHATAYVTKSFNNAICTNGFRVLRNLKINPFYLLYYLQSDFFLKQIYMYRTGAAIPAISEEDFSNILVYMPPENEIEKISSIVKKSFDLREMAKNEIQKVAGMFPLKI